MFVMQLFKNYVNLEHCLGQKFIVNVIKTTHNRSNFLKETCFTINICKYRFKKKYALKSLDFEIRKMLFGFYNIFMYLYDKNILEYVEIVVTDGNS